MKRLPLVIMIIALPCLMSAKVYRHDFGTFREDRGMQTHEFVLDGARAPFVIVKALPGCPCVKARYPKLPAKKGERMKVTVTYDPAGQNRHFTKSVYLRRSDGLRDTLIVTGTVVRTSEPYDKKKYPADFGMGLRLRTDGIAVGTLQRGQTKTITVGLINSYEAGMNLDLEPQGRDARMISVACGLRLSPLKEGAVRITVTVPADAAPGKLQATLQPTVNGCQTDLVPIIGKIL